MGKSILLYIEKKIPERDVLNFLNNCLPYEVESASHRNEKARYLLLFIEYSEGFHTCLDLGWPDDDELNIRDIEIATRLAVHFGTRVLFEPDAILMPNGLKWCMIDNEKLRYAVNIIEFEDGFTMNTDSMVRLPL